MKIRHGGLQNRIRDRKPNRKPSKFSKTAKALAVPLVAACLALAPKTADAHENNPAKKSAVENLTVGGKVIANEAGASIAGSLNYGMWGGFDFGVIAFSEHQAPFFTLSVTPGLEKKGVKFRYFGRLTFTNLNSWLYTSHSLALGYGKQFEKWGFSLGGIAGGALSYPNYDNIYFNMGAGLSFNYKEMLYVYAMAKSYFAAGNAMQSSYVGYYSPKYQGVEVGTVIKINEMVGKVYWDFDVIQSKGGVIVGTQFNISQKLKGFVGGGIGVTTWEKDLGGHANFMAQAMLNLYYTGDSGVTQEYKSSYERYQKGGIPLQTDINSPPQLRPLTPQEQVWEADAQQRLFDSDGSMDSFAAMYEGASHEEVITAARWMSRKLGELAYAYEAQEALMNLKFFDDSVKKVANASHDDILTYLRDIMMWYDTHGTFQGMSQELVDKITMCGGIHSTTALFLRKSGINAAVITVNTKNAMGESTGHFVPVYWTSEETGIIDYGDQFTGPANSLDEVIRAYGEYQGTPTYVSQIYIPKNNGGWDYKGTWLTPEGRLIQYSFGLDNFHLERAYILGVPGG